MAEIATSDAALLELARELEALLSPRGDAVHVELQREVRRPFLYKKFNWDVIYRCEPYLDSYRVVSVTVFPDMRYQEHRAVPVADVDDAPGGAKRRAAADAIAALGPLNDLMAKERHARYQEWCRANDRPVPSVRILQEVESAR